jgi:hypothetical protein
MLVSRAKAEEAMLEMGWGAESLATLTAEGLKAQYRLRATQTHPDAGGSAEAFARVDWAKCALEHWLKQPNTDRPAQFQNDCPNCTGKGYVQRQIGFKLGPRVQCARCSGTGDVDYVADTGKGDSL